MKSWLEKKNIENCSTRNEEKSAVAEDWKIKFISIWFQYQKMCLLIN